MDIPFVTFENMHKEIKEEALEKFKNIFKKYLTKQETQAIMKSQQRNKHPKKIGRETQKRRYGPKYN